jgi:hypothetical protein
MNEIKKWAAVENGLVVHGDFDASQEYIDSFVEQIVDRVDRTTPPWYNENITFVDVTEIEPRPTTNWFIDSGGNWVDGNPSLTTDRTSIPADGTMAAIITFAQQGPTTPTSVAFNVNGEDVNDTVINGVATLNVTSSNPGDVIVVTVGSNSVTITVEG